LTLAATADRADIWHIRLHDEIGEKRESANEEPAMSDDNQGAPSPARETGPSAFDVISPYLHPGRENVLLNYVLYLAGLVPAFGAVPIIVGFVFALINRPNATGIWADHYTFQVRSAGIGLLYAIVSGILVLAFGLGIILLLLTAVWWIVRAIRGMMAASRCETVPDPRTCSW
jgi:uncharacterized membrane protein